MTSYGLIDTTEMYLKAVFELEEEGILPLRARIAERLGQSGPTVSQTVARMERDGLLKVQGDRHLEFTARGHRYATQVMRKHRLAEVLLLDVVGLDWEHLHVEACRWEHVMSDDVERRIVVICEQPRACPHGNPVPGLDELGVQDQDPAGDEVATLTNATLAAPPGARVDVVLRRISERVQDDVPFMRELDQVGARPGATATLSVTGDGRVELEFTKGKISVDEHYAEALFVTPA